jgi:hypothetical protein
VDSPHLIVAEDEKIFVEEVIGNEVIVQERYDLHTLNFSQNFSFRTLVDTVYTLKDQVSSLREVTTALI